MTATETDPLGPHAGVAAIAAAVGTGAVCAADVAEAALARIEAGNGRLNAFTGVTAERALEEARAVDAARAAGTRIGPLAGVPFAVKNLYDIAGITTLAGSAINRANPAAEHDAMVVAWLSAAGALLTGALNMDEYAFGFTTENSHYGPTRNPHDPERIAGGSSGGSAAAVAGGLVPLSLGSDTNGSIRVPASLCGVFGLKPTYGRLSRRGAFMLSSSLDHVGPFARHARDLALAYDAMQGPDDGDPVCAGRPAAPLAPQLDGDCRGLRIAVAGGYFHDLATDEARDAVAMAAAALGAGESATIPEAHRARAAGALITYGEAGNLHLKRVREQAGAFDPLVRDRMIAAALTPASWYLAAQRFRRWFRERLLELFAKHDVILAPATPYAATPIGLETVRLNDTEMPARAAVGALTQPLTIAGVPVCVAPVVRGDGGLPIGIQIIAPPWREAAALQVALRLELDGVAAAPVATGQ